jgi:hypothetical protein
MMTTKMESESNCTTSDKQDRDSSEAIKRASGIPAQPGESRKPVSAGPNEGMEGDHQKSFLDIPRLIRSIQRAEGGIDCFGRKDACDMLDCVWRTYCLGSPRSEG